MISLLSLMNDNIQSLAGKLKDRGYLVEEGGQNREKARLDDDKATTVRSLVWIRAWRRSRIKWLRSKKRQSRQLRLCRKWRRLLKISFLVLCIFIFLAFGFWIGFLQFILVCLFSGLSVGLCYGLGLRAFFNCWTSILVGLLFLIINLVFCKTYGFQDPLKLVYLIKNIKDNTQLINCFQQSP